MSLVRKDVKIKRFLSGKLFDISILCSVVLVKCTLLIRRRAIVCRKSCIPAFSSENNVRKSLPGKFISFKRNLSILHIILDYGI